MLRVETKILYCGTESRVARVKFHHINPLPYIFESSHASGMRKVMISLLLDLLQIAKGVEKLTGGRGICCCDRQNLRRPPSRAKSDESRQSGEKTVSNI